MSISVAAASDAGSSTVAGTSLPGSPAAWRPSSSSPPPPLSGPIPQQPPQPPLPHRAKQSKPSRMSSKKPLSDLNFCMEPPPCIASLRGKVRGLRRKRRRPYDPIKVGSLLIKMEMMAVQTRKRRRRADVDRIRSSSRLESCITKIQQMPEKKKSHVS